MQYGPLIVTRLPPKALIVIYWLTHLSACSWSRNLALKSPYVRSANAGVARKPKESI